MATNSNSSSGGIGFFGFLTLIFIVLKLTGNLGWPWWQVLSPVWIPAAIVVVMVIIYVIWQLVKSLFSGTPGI